ncbi:MAG: acyltransferase family protein, partial [Clostridia bacterium]|nr:acyltransferase family protein [Clostridia bacterium]
MDKKRVLYFDALKILASFFIILIHVTAEKYYAGPRDLSWYINWGYNAISRWAVPVFCMVTGALLLPRENKVSTVIKKYILHIGLLLFFWGMYYWIIPTRSFTLSGLWNAFVSLLSGNAYSHLWYLYMLIGFYIALPMLSIITVNATKRTIEYFLLVLLFAGFVLPYLSTYFSFIK